MISLSCWNLTWISVTLGAFFGPKTHFRGLSNVFSTHYKHSIPPAVTGPAAFVVGPSTQSLKLIMGGTGGPQRLILTWISVTLGAFFGPKTHFRGLSNVFSTHYKHSIPPAVTGPAAFVVGPSTQSLKLIMGGTGGPQRLILTSV